MSASLTARARERFAVGDRVRLSDDGRERFPKLANEGKAGATGVVVGFPSKLRTKSEWDVRIKLDRSSSVRAYTARYFEIDPDGNEASAARASK